MLAPWKKSYDKPRQHTKKKTHDFANRGQSYGFSSSHVWMWELDCEEGWVLKNWCFWTVVLEKALLRVPWTEKRPNKSILREISPEYSLEGLMLKLKLQNFGHLMQRACSLEKTLMLGKIESKSRRVWQRRRLLGDIIDSIDMSLSKIWEMVKNRKAWCAAVCGVVKIQRWLCDWTTTNFDFSCYHALQCCFIVSLCIILGALFL